MIDLTKQHINLKLNCSNSKLFRILFLGVFFTFIVLTSACRDDFETVPSTGELEFSTDTLFLDTVFTNTSSSTYQFKVYNRSSKDINIPKIELGEGEASNYRLNVDGIPGKTFENIELLAKDSLFVFVEVTADIENLANQGTQFTYEDVVAFDTGMNQQNIRLISLIQDAVFLFPERFEDGTTETLSLGVNEEGEELFIEGFFLDDEHLHFTNEKPYVIYGFAGVPSGKTLTIDPGARIHFHANSGMIVANNGTIQANGEISQDQEALENEIIFQGDRLEPGFSEIPGQWATIWLTQGSTNHIFDYTTIKNGTVGILMDSNDGTNNPTLQLKNTQIYNHTNVGLLARTGFVEAENVVINNAGQAAVNLSLGGRYNFKHSTIANYWSNSFRQFPALLIENNLQTQEEVFVADLVEATFSNCIIYGTERIEVLFNQVDEAAFNYKFENCLIRFNDINNQYVDNPLYNFEDSNIFLDNVFNESPDFLNPNQNQLQIGLESAAFNLGNTNTAQEVPLDLLGINRVANPDSGAFQAIEFEEED
ncbi:hypothetical protein GCM10010832_09680 [Psychroflexus planctonicus]|uniref:Right handed beta helix region n=1 Tax=Psychroflexus planctonicus TaxID=1526575 RepID=A0ABQ1SH35_9FLAO|nr:hypothetical protein GCM10010832_09680 [Psychroflexus planctonicus]